MSTGLRPAELKACVADQQQTVGAVEFDPSFSAFVMTGSARLLRSAYLLTGDRDESEDLLQITLVRTARRWDVARESPHAYAHRVLVNLLHDRQRNLSRRVTEQRLEDFDDRLSPVTDGTQARIDRMMIISAVRRLPARQREVVVLRFFADLSVSETAAAIGASEGTVKTHTSRALAALRDVLTDEATESTTPKGPTLC
jgi:RNA polymerase sigma-70 factor (sigma-E family)